MKNNKLTQLLKAGKRNLLSIYVTAGYPNINDTPNIILNCQNADVDLMEIGIPFSDPLADGSIIQQSSQQALDNGMTLKLLLEQLSEIKSKVKIPILLMGYYNSILQYGVEKFCNECQKSGVSALIIPDLPLAIYQTELKEYFIKNHLHNILLITPQTAEERIVEIDNNSSAFIYAVSSASTTGSKNGITDATAFLKKLNQMNLTNPILTGFNIRDRRAYLHACEYTRGAIIGSAFIKALSKAGSIENNIQSYIQSILQNDYTT